MESTVNLQNPFSYNPMWIFIAAGATLLLVVAIILLNYFSKHRKPKEKKQKEGPKRPNAIKAKYLKQIAKIEEKLMENKLTSRKAYQKMSITVRSFVLDMTGKDVTTCTLADIRQMRLPELERLITEYYAPEFAEEEMSFERTALSINETKKVIEEWN